jgi:hypothetical protein
MLGSEWRDGVGAYLSLGLTEDTVRVRINGQLVGPVNQINPVVDVGPYLREGSNEIEVEVASSLLNRLLGMQDERILSGGFLGLDAPDPASYGLLGPVTLQPYAEQAL